MIRLRIVSFVFSSLFLVSPGFAEKAPVRITPGGPAPPLVVSRWIKGGPIERFEKGHIYVVDLWSTWCKPCLVTMPLLSRIQTRYAKDATIIGINVWEMAPDRVPAYVASQGDSMAIAVATDSLPPGKEANEGLMALAYLGTSETASIPQTILIDREGRVAWVGHPQELEDPLAQVAAGTWDVKSFAEKYAAEERLELKYQEVFRPVEAAVAASEWDNAFQASEAVVAADSSFAPRVAAQGFAYIAMMILKNKNADPAAMALAQRSAERAIALEKDPDWRHFQMAAQAARANGDLDTARSHLKAALERAQGDDVAKLRAELDELK
jgi:thiol-disulfide isomerase/thioredoxin